MQDRITVQIWNDKQEFFDSYADQWLENEGENIALYRIVPRSNVADSLPLSVHDNSGQTLQTAFLIPSDQILLSGGNQKSIEALCTFLVNKHLEIPGIFAPAPTSQQAAEKLETLTGRRYQRVKENLHLELHKLQESRSVNGQLQLAAEQHLDQLISHRVALQAELNTQRPFDSEKSVKTDLKNRSLYTWVNNQGQVIGSASLYLNRTPSSGYIDHVYVDHQHRRQGVASALVSQLCKSIREQRKTPRLSVDAANEPAYQAYLKIGFLLAARMENIRAQ